MFDGMCDCLFSIFSKSAPSCEFILWLIDYKNKFPRIHKSYNAIMALWLNGISSTQISVWGHLRLGYLSVEDLVSWRVQPDVSVIQEEPVSILAIQAPVNPFQRGLSDELSNNFSREAIFSDRGKYILTIQTSTPSWHSCVSTNTHTHTEWKRYTLLCPKLKLYHVKTQSGCWPTRDSVRTQGGQQWTGENLCPEQGPFHFKEGHSWAQSGLRNKNSLREETKTDIFTVDLIS